MKHPTREECERLLEEYGTPEPVRRHCRAVAETAYEIGRELNRKGYRLDLDLILAAGLLHDIARVEDMHWEVGADLMKEMGYDQEGDIIRVHMKYDFSLDGDITEADLVCLGDRLVLEDTYVGLDKRIDYIVKKAARNGHPEAKPIILRKKEEARSFMARIEDVIGCSIDALMAAKSGLDDLLKKVEKPARYIGGEVNSIRKDPRDVSVRVGFAFPDIYEIGMSYMGLQILYHILNANDEIYCERVFAPAPDMEALMRQESRPLFTLETFTPVNRLDILGFTLQYELSYTNVLNMLELGGIPIRREDRGEETPVIIAGGPCAFNPEPLADFVDAFLIGDGEELLEEVCLSRKECDTKEAFLKKISSFDGVYVPSFYQPVYKEDGTIERIHKLWDGAPDRVRRAILPDLDKAAFPVKSIVPFIDTVHDRSVVETFRGCTRGCRFCQAGMIYRPVRERQKETVSDLACRQLANTGHDELSLLSLSTSDHSQFEEMAVDLMKLCREQNVALSLPSLRLDSFSFRVLEEIQGYRKSGLTFAPEAGSQRLRDIINKNITEEDIYRAVEQAIELGWETIKLYFMAGLPGETYEDLDGIGKIAGNIVDINFRKRGRKGGRFRVTVSVSNFVPKPHTPFQWAAQDTPEQFIDKHNHLAKRLRIKGVSFNYHETQTSRLEAIFARGDRRVGDLLEKAHSLGCRFDGWTEYYRNDLWEQAIKETDTDVGFYNYRERSYDEILPWDIIDPCVSRSFLMSENEKAKRMEITDDCRKGCTGCGMNRFTECFKGVANLQNTGKEELHE